MRNLEKMIKKGMMMGVLAIFMIAGILLSPVSRMDVKAGYYSPTYSEEKENGSYKYRILTYHDENGEAAPQLDCVQITGYTENEEVTEITIPDEIDGYKVTEIIPSAFENCSGVTAVILPKTVRVIYDRAFQGCTNLKSIVMDGVFNVGTSAFEGCKNLENITFSDNLRYIDTDAFKGTAWLKEQQKISPFVIVNGTLVSISATDAYIEIPEGVTILTAAAFSDCERTTQIKLPKSLFANESALHACINLKEILVDEENPWFSAEDGILYNKNKTQLLCCPGKKERAIHLPDGMTSIERSAFHGCSSLKEVKIPDGVTSIGEYAFHGCNSLSEITLPDGVTSIGGSAFDGCSSLMEVTLPDGVTSIGEWAFDGCSSLAEIKIPDGVTSIGGSAFQGCSSLTEVKIPDGMTSIGQWTFSGCSSLAEVKIPDGVTSIGQDAFVACDSLREIRIPKTVTNIGEHAFLGCFSLTDINYSGTIENWTAIEKGEEAIPTNATIHCSDGTIASKDSEPENPEPENPKPETPQPDTSTEPSAPAQQEPEMIALQKIDLSADTVTYTGRACTPSVTVTDADGHQVDAANYTVTYTDNKNVGQATVTVTGTNRYTGTLTAVFTILPKGTTITKLAAEKKGFAVKWKKQDRQVSGYQLEYSANKNFKSAKTITVKKTKTVSAKVNRLKAKKKYYVRIRTFCNVKINGKSKRLCSEWSKVKTVKTKK